MPAPDSVRKLVERFQDNRDSYKSAGYNETQVRREFLDPLFKALGWDVDNQQGHAEAYKDVIHEDAINVGGVTKAPDYCFRIGGRRIFFLEAKKPSVNIGQDVNAAFQLRRYAWSAKLPLSILSDFEEMAVYDCRIRPDRKDKPAIARVLLLNFEQYNERWDELSSVFARDAVLKGSFDKYAEGKKLRRGTAEVDAAFLGEIETWRKLLATNLALRNPSLEQRDLNFAVQRTIDRLIFLRMCEDRGIEPYGQLQLLVNGEQVYGRLREMFDRADDRYNSGLFHFHAEKGRAEEPDEITQSLILDDKPIKEIVRGLYYPESPYEFSVLAAEILGQVYEQFLGKVIRLTAGHQAKIEDKPEVKKNGGVFYTPGYIVAYIVKRTVGRLVEEKDPEGIAKLRFVDPACGSGSFLVGALQFLFDWHRDWYVEHDPQKYKKEIYQGRGGQWFLTAASKKRILLNNIYGVDIDSQAVEVTKLSLLLKVLEHESREAIEKQLHLLRQRALPDLGNNIKCGNSLVASDYYRARQTSMLNDDDLYRINAFDWAKEFPSVMRTKRPGFDAVIGNPPWGGDIDKELSYFHSKYPATTQEHTDSFKLFVEAGLRLTRGRGRLGMIVPNPLLRQRRIKDVRALLLESSIDELVDLGENVFANVVAPSCIFVVERRPPTKTHQVVLSDLHDLSNSQKAAALDDDARPCERAAQTGFKDNPDLEFMVPEKQTNVSVVALGKFPAMTCKDAGINYQRVNVGMREKGNSDLAARLLYEGKCESRHDKMYWKGTDINRYWIAEKTERWCRPNYKTFLRKNEVVHLSNEVFDTAPKILIRQTADRIIAACDYRGVWFGRSIIALVPARGSEYSIEYFLGLLNSKLFEFHYHRLVREQGRVFAQVKLGKLKQLPIRLIDFSDGADRARHGKMVALVQEVIQLHERRSSAKQLDLQTRITRRIDAAEDEINELACELYDVDTKKIAMISTV